MLRPRSLALLCLLVLLSAPACRGAEKPFRYPEGKHGKGELKYVNGLPVLMVEGTPQEIGEQIGVLALKPAPQIMDVLKEFLKDRKLEKVWPLLVTIGNGLFANFPADYRAEVEAMVKASGLKRDGFIVANTVMDYTKLGGCSTLIVEGERSAGKGPLFGRNWDFPPAGKLYQYTLVIVYRPQGKHAFATVTLPGLIIGPTVINDAGLALAANEVTSASDGSSKFNAKGTPLEVGMRRLMEECTTISEAEKLCRSLTPTTMILLTLCDKKAGAVFEATTKQLIVRRAEENVCCCTNHFRCKGLVTSTKCSRYDMLDKSREKPRLDVAEVAKQLDAVNQGADTLHTMVFEPASLRLHLAFGKGPSSKLPLKTLDLALLFRKERGVK
ncbi:MAG TPA: C45 family peptidase [Gemmataceae bacterium]|nr:C45 family peptidase [Gemmataceae bacterium]